MSRLFKPGETLVRQEIWRGTVWMAVPEVVVEDDVEVTPDGASWTWKDREDFEAAIERGIYSSEARSAPGDRSLQGAGGQPDDQKNQRHRDQHDAGSLLGALTQHIADAMPDAHAELRRDERLDRDPDHRDHQ